MIPLERIVVVGASLAGLRAVQTLRERGFAGELTVIGEERFAPYDRPPLSKQILQGEWEPERALLEELDVIRPLATWKLGIRAQTLDLQGRRVLTVDGIEYPYDRLLIATGASPIPFPNTPQRPGLFTLRTMEDAVSLRDAMTPGRRLVVIGGGFIGCEVAAAGIKRGLAVTILEALEAPVQRVLGLEVGHAIARLHREHGVDVRCGVRVQSIDSDPVTDVTLAGGEVVPADIVVVGIGARPNTGWLDGSGLALENGIRCDEFCRASDPAVFAAGDVANWYNPLFGTRMRIEHWTNAVEQGIAAAENMLATDEEMTPFAPVPYVWSDQYASSLRFAGYAAGYEEMRVLDGSIDGPFVAGYRTGERLSGVLAFDMGKRFSPYQRMIARGTSWAEATRSR